MKRYWVLGVGCWVLGVGLGANAQSPSPGTAPSAVASPASAASVKPLPVPSGSATQATGATANPGGKALDSPKPGVSPVPVASATPAPAPTPQVIVIPMPQATPAPDPTAGQSSWAAGVIGLLLMGGGIVYGLRFMKNRGMTVPDALKQIGVEMPQDGGGASVAHLKPPPPPLPPLPSLSELPSAGQPASGVATPLGTNPFGANPLGTFATAPLVPRSPTGKPRLAGIGGPVDGTDFDLDGPFTVGRDAINALALTGDTTISRQHARFVPAPGGYAVADNGSSNGTYVNGQKLIGEQLLQSGDEIQIGMARFRYES